MSKYPEITNPEYHKMSFENVEKIRKKVTLGEVEIFINETQLFLYLNQMEKKYSTRLRWIQNIFIVGFMGTLVFIFINWKFSPFLFLASIIAQIVGRNLAKKYIYKQCSDDKVFLKFALGEGLVKIQN